MSDEDCERAVAGDAPVLSDGGESLLNRVFGALAHQRRRYALYYLRDNERVQTDELACQIAAWERDVPTDEVPAEVSDRVHAELVHSHLPKLEDYSLVEYDQRSGDVGYTYPPSVLDDVLKLAASIEDPR
jgi:DNA-binding transcriptional ArsR family regulator